MLACFVLNGALLIALWYDTPHRPTKDADLLGLGADDADTLRSTFTAIDAARRIADNAKVSASYVTQVMYLAFPAPDIVEWIVHGRRCRDS